MTPPDEPRNLPEDHLRQSEGGQPAQPAQQNPYEPTSPYPQAGQQQPYGQAPYGQAQPAPGFGQQLYGQPGYGYGGPGGGQPHPSAATAMVLGIVALAGIVFCAGVTLVLSPFAWYIGRKAVKEIDANPGRYAGRDQAKGGQIMGIIGTVLLALGILLIVGVFALFFATVGEAERITQEGRINPSPSSGTQF